MKDLAQALRREFSAGRRAVLAHIVERTGSAPRGVGAAMLVCADGTGLGTIGGGAVEYAAQKLAGELLSNGQSQYKEYALFPGGDIGMICGGQIRVHFLCVSPGDQAACDQAMEILGAANGGTVYLFGGGHVGQALAKILAMTDFHLVVCDQRQEIATREVFPHAAALHCCPFENALETVGPIGGEDYVVVMTPGHQADYEVLVQVLATPAKYIGCIGSRRKVAATRERLLAAGFSEQDIDRIHSPIGLDIGGETPAEIAVSVAAQLIACRSGKLE